MIEAPQAMDHQDESPSPSARVKLVASTGDITAGPAAAVARDSRGDGDIRAYFETATRRYTILDAPGHKTYVPSMITGAAQADVAILVISARKGEFETGFERGGQTREHIMLVKTAGVGKLIVVINKMDDPTVGWAKARFDEIKEKLTPFVRGAGFNPKTDVTWLPVSAYTGANLKDRVASSVCAWWECVTKLAACPFPLLCSRSRSHLSL